MVCVLEMSPFSVFYCLGARRGEGRVEPLDNFSSKASRVSRALINSREELSMLPMPLVGKSFYYPWNSRRELLMLSILFRLVRIPSKASGASTVPKMSRTPKTLGTLGGCARYSWRSRLNAESESIGPSTKSRSKHRKRGFSKSRRHRTEGDFDFLDFIFDSSTTSFFRN